MNNKITGAEIHEEVFCAKDKVNGQALEGLLLALAEGKPTEEFLSVLRKAAHSALHELSCEKDFVNWMEGIEHDDYVASVHHAAMM